MWHSSPCSSMRGTNTPTPWITPHRFTPRIHSHCASEICQVGPAICTPALLHRICTLPYASSVRSSRFCTLARLRTSVGTPSTLAPAARSFCTAAFERAGLDVGEHDLQPSCAKRSASA